jgi:hypothetical protein
MSWFRCTKGDLSQLCCPNDLVKDVLCQLPCQGCRAGAGAGASRSRNFWPELEPVY